MNALIDFREYMKRKQQKEVNRSQPRRMSFAMFRALHRAADGRTGYVVMSNHGIVKSPLEYYGNVALHRCEIFAWQGNRVQLRHGNTLAWWTFSGDEMVVIEYAEAAATVSERVAA